MMVLREKRNAHGNLDDATERAGTASVSTISNDGTGLLEAFHSLRINALATWTNRPKLIGQCSSLRPT